MGLKELHDKLAYKAEASGKTAGDFTAAAQRKANATWLLLIMAGVVWYFVGLVYALIPGALAIITALMSFSSTAIAERLK